MRSFLWGLGFFWLGGVAEADALFHPAPVKSHMQKQVQLPPVKGVASPKSAPAKPSGWMQKGDVCWQWESKDAAMGRVIDGGLAWKPVACAPVGKPANSQQ